MQASDTEIYGKLTIKVRLGDDVRRIQIHNEAITFDELLLMLQRVFRGKLNENDDITLKYKDEDGDLITIDNNTDLCLAIRFSPVLKLEIFGVPDKAAIAPLDSKQLKKLKQEVQEIRDRAIRILDTIDHTVSNQQVSHDVEEKAVPLKQQPSKLPEAKEFDPLQKPELSNGAADVKEGERREGTPVGQGFDRPPSAQSHYPISSQQQQQAPVAVSYHQNVQVPPSQTPHLPQQAVVTPQLQQQQQHSVQQYPPAGPTHQQYPGQYPPGAVAQSYQSMPAGYPAAMSYSMQSQQQQTPQQIYSQGYNQAQQGPPKLDNVYRQGDLSSNPYSKQMPPPAAGGYQQRTQY